MDYFDFSATDDDFSTDLPKMTNSEFVEKTQKLLKKIETAFSESSKRIQVPDEFLIKSQCDKCECGECVLKINGIEKDIISNDDGYCTYFGNTDSIYDLMQNIMFEDPDVDFYALMYSETVDKPE